MLDRSYAYRDIALTANEAAAFLELDWSRYQDLVGSGRFALSLDLCETRPSVFKAHAFWDIIEFSLIDLLVTLGDIESGVEQEITVKLLDDVAFSLEITGQNGRIGDWSKFEKDLRIILRSSLSSWGLVPVKLVLRKWSDLEDKLLKLLQQNGFSQ